VLSLVEADSRGAAPVDGAGDAVPVVDVGCVAGCNLGLNWDSPSDVGSSGFLLVALRSVAIIGMCPCKSGFGHRFHVQPTATERSRVQMCGGLRGQYAGGPPS
jgi:hypothetical protein